MKYFKKLLFIFILPCMLLLNGCSLSNENEKVYITNIVQTENVGEYSTYTIFYSDGSTSIMSLKNGKDGSDGLNMTMEDIKTYCDQNGLVLEDFLKNFNIIEENNTIIEDSNSTQNATNKAINSAVTIWSEFPVINGSSKDVTLSRGAGIIYKMDEINSYIITNYHVVYYTKSKTDDNIASKVTIFQYGADENAYKPTQKDANGYPITIYGEGAITAEYIGGSMNYDIALLKVPTADLKAFNQHASAVSIAEDYHLGETAIAIGNPEGEGFSATRGIVSVVSEEIQMTGADDYTPCEFRVMRIDTAVNGGNSGGGLFDIDGKLIGIVNAKAVASEIDNIAYALPVDNVVKVAENILYYHNLNSTQPAEVRKLVLDIEYTIVDYKAEYDPETNTTTLYNKIKVMTVDNLGIGKRIGLEKDDIIDSIIINDSTSPITFNLDYQLKDILLTLRPGDKFLLNITRNGQPKQCGITISSGLLITDLEIIE